MIPLLLLLQFLGLGPFTAAWNPDPPPGATALRLYVDDVLVSTLPPDVTSAPITVPAMGPHVLGLTALIGDFETAKATFAFTALGTQADPCATPLGAHAPAVFLTSVTVTTGRPGSRSFLSFQLAGPDPFVETAVQVDGVDATVSTATDARAYGSQWFTQPPTGTHRLGLRVRTAFGCTLVRVGPTLVVK